MKKYTALFALIICSTSFAYRDLETGTFLTRDPIGFEDGPNQYCYVHANPIIHFDAYGLDTFFVLGSYNDNGKLCTFTPEAKASYMKSIGDTGQAHDVQWSGENNADGINQGAENIKAAVDTFRSKNPDTPANVVGYSNGGNAVIEASNKGAKFDNTVTVGTPVTEAHQPSDSSTLGNWYNVYSDKDPVQANGGNQHKLFGQEFGPAGRTFDKTKNPNVTNIKVPQNDLSSSAAKVKRAATEHFKIQNEKGPQALASHIAQQGTTPSQPAPKTPSDEEITVPDTEQTPPATNEDDTNTQS